MAEEGKIEGVQSPKPGELEAQFVVPAILANRVYVTVGAAGVILTFSENISADVTPQPRARVVIPYADALQFLELFQKMLAPIKAALETAPTISVNTAPKDG